MAEDPEAPSDDGKRKPGFSIGRVFGTKLPLETETVRFIFANAMDLFVTYLALNLSASGRTSRPIAEGNPIPLWFINRWGVKGMVYFKFAMVVFIVLLAQYVAQRKMTSARRLLNFGTVVVGGVAIYSVWLLVRAL